MPQEHTPHPPSFVDKKQHIHISGTKLPHWHQPHRTQFVTFRLGGTLPKEKLLQLTALNDLYLQTKDTSLHNSIDLLYDHSTHLAWLKCPVLRKTVADNILAQDHDTLDLYAFVVMPNHVHLLASPLADTSLTATVGTIKSVTSHLINKFLRQQSPLCDCAALCPVGREQNDSDTLHTDSAALCPFIYKCISTASETTSPYIKRARQSSSQKPPFYWQREVFDYLVRDSVQFRQFVEYIKANPEHLPPHTFTLYSKI